MTRRLLLAALVAACVFAPTAEAAKRTCRSGQAISKQGGVRVFEIGGNEDVWLACGPRTRRPVELYSAPGGYAHFRVSGRSGDKVLFVGEFSGEGGGEETTVGWFDARTSQARAGELAGHVSNEVVDVIAAADGGMGVAAAIEGDAGMRVGYLAPGGRTLRDELALATAPGYVHGSLAFAGGSLAWTVAGRPPRSVPLAGEAVACASGTTVAEADGARVFEVLPDRRTQRGFQADVLAACARGASVPTELGVSDLYDQDHWEGRSVKRVGARVAFVAGYTGVGLLDAGQVHFTVLKDIEFVADVAVGATGPLAFAGDLADASYVARVDGDKWELLATQGGPIAADSLAVGDDGRVSWRTESGTPQSVPLTGETATGCAAGTTLLDKDGLRVSELLLAGAEDARLVACAPTPVQLLTGPRLTVWKVTELARENGRVAVYVTGEFDDRVISFDAGGDVRAGETSTFGKIRDVALAADGRVALARRDEGEWKVTAFTRTRERILARPADGVAPGSLGIKGARVVWRSTFGAARSARLSG